MLCGFRDFSIQGQKFQYFLTCTRKKKLILTKKSEKLILMTTSIVGIIKGRGGEGGMGGSDFFHKKESLVK